MTMEGSKRAFLIFEARPCVVTVLPQYLLYNYLTAAPNPNSNSQLHSFALGPKCDQYRLAVVN